MLQAQRQSAEGNDRCLELEELRLNHGQVKKEASIDEYIGIGKARKDGTGVVFEECLRCRAIYVELDDLENF